MKDGIYTVRYIPYKGQKEFSVECVNTAMAACLMNFLKFIFEDTLCLEFSPESYQIIKDLKMAFLATDSNDPFMATKFFFKRFPEELVLEISKRYPKIDHNFVFNTEKDFESFMEENAGIVKSVIISKEGIKREFSYCTVKYPIAYLCDSVYDSAGRHKFSIDKKFLDKVSNKLMKFGSVSYRELQQYAESFSLTSNIDINELLLIIETLLIKKTIHQKEVLKWFYGH